MRLSISQEALALEVHRRREAWLEENREAIEAYNEHVRQKGVFSAGLGFIRDDLEEETEDLAAIRERAGEQGIPLEEVVQDLKRRGKE